MTLVQFASRKKVGQARKTVLESEQIEAIEKEIRETPYNKSTERHIGLLRAKIARLKDQQIDASTRRRQGSGGASGYALRKQGDATIVLVGAPSVGKSTLLNKLTNAKSKVAPYAFTTVTVIPGMMEYKDALIQILDVPGLIKGAEEGKGRGREVLSVVRGADLLLIMTDPKNLDAFKSMSDALERNGIRINKISPDVTIETKAGGGIIIHSNIKQDFDNDTIKEVATQFGLKNAEITIREKLSWDRLTDAFARNKVYIPAIFVINKSDILDKNLNDIYQLSRYQPLKVSAKNESGLDELKQVIWTKLNFVQIYLVKNSQLDKQNPMVVKKNITLKQVAEKIGSDFAESKQKAKIWGMGAKFPGQEVSLSTKVQEGMMVRFI